MTEALPVTDVSLEELLEAGAGNGVCVGAPVATVQVTVSPLGPSGDAEGEPTTEPCRTGEISVRAPHVKDRYDALWSTERASSREPGWHRTGDVGHLDPQGRLWVEGRLAHVVTTPDGVVTPVGVEQRVERLAEVQAAAAVGVGPRGTQVLAVVVVPADNARRRSGLSRLGRKRLRLAPAPLAGAVREAAGTEVAAVLVARALPVDIRHGSKIDRQASLGSSRPVPRRVLAPVRVLVTGASGMLGRATAQALVERGDDVCVLQRRPSGLACREVLGDVADPTAVRRATRGQDAVVHLAAKVDVVGRRADYDRANIAGTREVVDACLAEGVGRLVHVSTPSVAHAGRSLVGVGAGAADADAARGSYARSKAVAEQLALSADSAALAVLAVRPHLVWGPGDTQLVSRIVARARAGRLPVLGTGAALIDTTYIDNASAALVAALDAAGPVHGEPLVVTNGEPRPVAEILTSLCRAAGVPPPRIRVPACAGTAGRDGGRRDLVGLPPRGRAADHPVPRRAADDGALVRPAPHPGRPRVDARGQPRRGVREARRVVRRAAIRVGPGREDTT